MISQMSTGPDASLSSQASPHTSAAPAAGVASGGVYKISKREVADLLGCDETVAYERLWHARDARFQTARTRHRD
jgi:hypothetical protein